MHQSPRVRSLLRSLYRYNGRNGALETHWKDRHSHLSAIGQPFPAIAPRESLVPSKKPVKKTSTKLSWPSLDDVLAHYQVALGEHPVNPPTQHLPIPYPPHLIHTMRHVAIPDECDSYPTPQALPTPSPVFYPMEGGIISTPSIPYSQPMAGFAPDLQQFYADGLLPTFDQCLTALQPMAPLNHSSFGATPTMVSPSFTSSSFSTLDGPWDFPIANQQIQFDMVGNGFMDLSSAPFVPMPQSSIFESEGVWDQHSGPFLNGYI